MTFVGRQHRDQILGQLGTRAFYPLADLSLSAFFFNLNIDMWSPFVGQIQPPGTFAENGIPPNLFSDVNVRKGFAYAFDYNRFLRVAYLGEGEQPSDPVIKGVLYDNPEQEKYVFSLSKATYYLKLAWGGVDANGNGIIDPINEPGDVEGSLWTNGMTFTIPYNPSSTVRPNQIAAEIIVENINSLNPKFHLTIGYAWRFYPPFIQEMPIFMMGWLADYPDAHDFVFPFMHSQGGFAIYQSYGNATLDFLIDVAAVMPDGPMRQQAYYDLQAIYHNDVPSVPIYQGIGRYFERDWVRGWHYNPVLPGNDVYHMWKAKTHFGDANNDGTVDISDVGYISNHWGPVGLPYNQAADLNGGTGGLTGTEYIRGMPDGIVDIVDIGLVSAYWDGPPQGPVHP
jgi:peptide/nickel transport system substrate-binding protein